MEIYCRKKQHHEKKCRKSYPCPCDGRITSLPYVITKSGTYTVKSGLIYKGIDTAISIQANNVTVTGGSITSTQTGIPASPIILIGTSGSLTNINIKNISLSSISSGQDNGNYTKGVSFNGVSSGSINNINTENLYNGVYVNNSSDITIDNDIINNSGGSETLPQIPCSIFVDSNSNNITLSNITQNYILSPNNSYNGILVYGVSGVDTNISISNISSSGYTTVINIKNVIGGSINNITINQNASQFAGIGLGISGELTSQNIDINNVSITNVNAPPLSGWDGIIISQAINVTISNVTINGNALNIPGVYPAAAIHVGDGTNGGFANNVTISNVTVTGANNFAVTFDGANNAKLQNSNISQGQINIYALNSTGLTIENDNISGPPNSSLGVSGSTGISFQFSSNSLISGNLIQNNAVIGEILDANSHGNNTTGNIFKNNRAPQYLDEDTNTSSNNIFVA